MVTARDIRRRIAYKVLKQAYDDFKQSKNPGHACSTMLDLLCRDCTHRASSHKKKNTVARYLYTSGHAYLKETLKQLLLDERDGFLLYDEL